MSFLEPGLHMARTLKEVAAYGPFEETIVKDPWHVEPAVRGLNDAALGRLLDVLGRLEPWYRPHEPIGSPKAQLIMSGAPGYGKSHLLGRLFEELGARATRVYLHPFEDASSLWTSLLQACVHELNKPEWGKASTGEVDVPNQLDAIAHGVLGLGLALMIEAGEANVEGLANPQALLASGIGVEWDLSDHDLPLTQAFADTFERLLPFLARRIASLNIQLSNYWSSPYAWLRILYQYASSRRSDAATREQCLDWLRGKAYQDEDLSALGLTRKELVPVETTPKQADQICRARLFDLCQFASFYRPFVFCFDQTETYRHDENLAWSFGHLICTLVNEASNHLCVVTANQLVWERCIAPRLENAHKARLDTPVWLVGITKAQGMELIESRLRYFDVRDDEIRRFQTAVEARADDGGGGARSVRQFIEECHAELQRLVGEGRPDPPSLYDLYKKEYQEALEASDQLDRYNADLYRWIVGHVLGAEKVNSPRDYFPLALTDANGTRWLFGFEESAHHARWHGRLKEAGRRHQTEQAIAVNLRIGKQTPIPGNWKQRHEFEEAKTYFRIHVVNRERLAQFHALWNLYAKACQQDIPFQEEAVIRLAAEKLQSWWEEIRLDGREAKEDATPQSSVDSDDTIAPAVSKIVRAYRFIAFNHLQTALEKDLGRKVEQREAIEASRSLEHVTVKDHPTNAIFLWQ